jgi:hypothetical protein
MGSGEQTQSLNLQLQRLICEARSHPSESVERQAAFSEIVRLVMASGKLWRESTIYYPDALQEMWEYCLQHIDDPEQGYDPSLCTVTTWLDDRLKKILRRYRDRKRRQQKRHLMPFQADSGQLVDPVDMLVAPADSHNALRMWTALILWVRNDPDHKLRSRTCMRYPHVNARTLLLRRLPPNEQSWDDIAAELGADKKYLAQWYSRYCNSLLREWGQGEGYLDNDV